MRYFLHIAFDGSKYRGWQRQPEVKSVQDAIEKCLSKIFKTKIGISGCGRTDAGVHASQFFFHFDTDTRVEFDLKFILNKNLPKDIATHDIIVVEKKQHTRFDATSRTYDYFIHFDKDPVLDSFSTLYQNEKWDFDLMQQAVTLLCKGKDFRQLCKQPDLHNHTICEIYEVTLKINASKSRMHLSITANRFLRGMIRIIVANLVDVGRETITLQQFQNRLDCTAPETENTSAAPNGLFLSRIKYDYLDIPEKESICTFLKKGY